MEFLLLDALLRLANVSDHLVVMKAYESILTCASLQHSSVTLAMSTSLLPVMLSSKLQFHFQLIPPNTKHTTILSCNGSWGYVGMFEITVCTRSVCTYLALLSVLAQVNL